MLGDRAINSFLHGLAQNPWAELLFQHSHRDFAFAKALHFNGRLGFDQFLVHLRVKFGGGKADGIASFQAFVQGLVDLHLVPRFIA